MSRNFFNRLYHDRKGFTKSNFYELFEYSIPKLILCRFNLGHTVNIYRYKAIGANATSSVIPID